jgi:hypothetical protein
MAWSDPASTPSLDLILQETSLYWFTDTFSTSIYPYRQLFTPGLIGAHENPKWKIPRGKGFGFSWFPYEIAPVPRAWVESTVESGKVDVSSCLFDLLKESGREVGGKGDGSDRGNADV